MKQDMVTKRCLISEMSASSLEKYNLRIDEQPTTLKAKVLKPAEICFGNKNIPTKNGSFNLIDVRFSR